jgi:hypothetical protein
MATMAVRFKYYFAWLFADAIVNNAGLGFNGYESDGTAKWDMLTNIYVIPFEVSLTISWIVCHYKLILSSFSSEQISAIASTAGTLEQIRGFVWSCTSVFIKIMERP